MSTIRNTIVIITAFCLAAPAIATAQYHHDGICIDGNCNANTANFGYYQTGWRRWPTAAPASSFVDASPTSDLDSLPPAELPDPRFEGDISPPPLRDPLPPFQLPAPQSLPDQSRQLPAPVTPQRVAVAATVDPEVPRFEVIAKPLAEVPVATAPPTLSDEPAIDAAVKLPEPSLQPIVLVSWTNPLRSDAPTAPATEPLPIELPSLPPSSIPDPAPLPVTPVLPVTPASYEEPTRSASPVTLPSTNPLRSNLPHNPLRDQLDLDDGQLRNPLRTGQP